MQAVANTAREMGYRQIKISVESHLKKEIQMYKRWGFVELEKYAEMPELEFLGLDL